MRWKVGKHNLKSNGIPVYHFYDSGGTMHLCGLGWKIGSIHDPADALGMAHLVEHVLFRGIPRHTEDPVYDMIFRYFGGMENHNIFTTYANTYYGGPELYVRRYIHEVMKVITDVLKSRYITAEGLAIEKTVINNEYRQTDLDDPNSMLDSLFYETMYDTNPVRNSIIGDMEQLKALTPQKVRKFIERTYVSGNMFGIVFGPNRSEAIKIGRKYLDDWPHLGSPTVLDTSGFDLVPAHSSPRVAEQPRSGQKQYYVAAGFPTAVYKTKEDAALDVIAKVVERRLYDVIRERGHDLTEGNYHNPIIVDRTLTHGSVGAWFATASKDFALYGRDAIVREFTRLREELIPEQMFDNARDSLREKFYSNFRDTPGEVVNLVVDAISNGDPDLKHLHSYPDRLNALTRSRVRQVANKYFNPNGFVSATVTPA